MSYDRAVLDSLLLWLDRFGARINEILSQASAQTLNRRVRSDLPTLAEVAAHLLITENFYLRHILGDENLPAAAPVEIQTTWDLQSLPAVINGRTILDSSGRAESAEDLVAAHRDSHHSIHGRLAAASDAQLAHFYDGPYNRGDTLSGVVALLLAHEGYHLSELRLIALLATSPSGT